MRLFNKKSRKKHKDSSQRISFGRERAPIVSASTVCMFAVLSYALFYGKPIESYGEKYFDISQMNLLRGGDCGVQCEAHPGCNQEKIFNCGTTGLICDASSGPLDSCGGGFEMKYVETCTASSPTIDCSAGEYVDCQYLVTCYCTPCGFLKVHSTVIARARICIPN